MLNACLTSFVNKCLFPKKKKKRLKRYKNNKQRKFENKLFRNNEKLFYKNLADNKTQNNNGLPNINEIKEFWSNIWSNEVQFNRQNGFLI
jgi:hypothetical protein